MASDPKAVSRLDEILDDLWMEVIELQMTSDEKAFLMRQRINTVRKMAGLPERTANPRRVG